MPITPERLSPGDVVGIVAPASPPLDSTAIDRSVEFLERIGYKPRLAPNVRQRRGFLAGSDRDRAADLMKIFADRQVKAVLCIRGGYGTGRLLPLLDYGLIRRNPKIFIGYSDITSLHCALLKFSNLVSFHGPMLQPDFIKKDLPDFTLQSFIRTVTLAEAPGSISKGCRKKTSRVLKPGRAEGPLVGGNLSLLCSLLGTPWQPSFKNRILFLEDLDEVPYRFDRMLTQLLNAGMLQQVAGVAIAVNMNCQDPRAVRTSKEYRQSLEDVLKERLLPLGVPVICGLPFGHIRMNATLPIGVRATLDGKKGDLLVTEPAVR
jgi:muramoyltetrapeptide carboxypeptidase